MDGQEESAHARGDRGQAAPGRGAGGAGQGGGGGGAVDRRDRADVLPVWTAPLAQASFGLGRVGQFAYLYPASWERSQRPNGESARAGLNRWPAYRWPR